MSNISNKPFKDLIKFFGKKIRHYKVTKTLDNVTGDETLSYDTGRFVTAMFFTRDQAVTAQQVGLLNEADAIVQFNPGYSFSRNDKIEYDGETYRVDNKTITRRLGATKVYEKGECFKIDDYTIS